MVREVETLNLASRPFGFAQKSQARLHARVNAETANVDLLSEAFPAVPKNQILNDVLQRNAVQGVLGLVISHGVHLDLGERLFADLTLCASG